jgi:hypothetical protein
LASGQLLSQVRWQEPGWQMLERLTP